MASKEESLNGLPGGLGPALACGNGHGHRLSRRFDPGHGLGPGRGHGHGHALASAMAILTNIDYIKRDSQILTNID